MRNRRFSYPFFFCYIARTVLLIDFCPCPSVLPAICGTSCEGQRVRCILIPWAASANDIVSIGYLCLCLSLVGGAVGLEHAPDVFPRNESHRQSTICVSTTVPGAHFSVRMCPCNNTRLIRAAFVFGPG